MDSIDAALVDFSGDFPQLVDTQAMAMPASLKQDLFTLCEQPELQPQRDNADKHLAKLFTEASLKLISTNQLEAEDIRAIGSHGQTIFHQPPQNGENGYSVQIGDPQSIANQTGITTVGDFRNADMQAGGQGAPLVPAFHNAVFRSSDKPRVIVNIGGISNITVLPVKGQGQVTGFDTGTGNVLLDIWVRQHQQQSYDDGGTWAAQGVINQTLLNQMMADDYFKLPPPKSTGREYFHHTWLEQQLNYFAETITPVDVQATLVALTSRCISDAIEQYAPATEEVFICGGGAYNTTLMEQLKKDLSRSVTSTDLLGIKPDWVEAMAFAWLAKQTLADKPGNIPSVTGATSERVLGHIHHC